jgi:regulator of protease activity HflC (stomatin/prohibitin superfamily)
MCVRLHNVCVQAVSLDNGIVQLGATVYYRISDAALAVTTVADWNQSTRTLAHTTLHRLINKRKSVECTEGRKALGDDLMVGHAGARTCT